MEPAAEVKAVSARLGESFTLSLAVSRCSPEALLTRKELWVLPQHLGIVCKEGLSRVGGTCMKLVISHLE